ncbi:glycine-rich RNA-binding protein 4, mitochondrial-like [Papaver somniferum]|uniref:glycine-rich RNA-binding protein 4, mitochondrial-like n=1 Tax=Papaver somniferum TaxID=3469 RepID=UPI000E704600|nr:glycine-rich RNA-binding protein 4, mitochondrial-like [Papaver somniferum]
MAFASKLGSLVRQANGQGSLASMYNAVRCMSGGPGGSKLFIGGLSYDTDDNQLKAAFDNFGVVTDARVITDRDTGRSRGFGFVSYSCEENASQALTMDGRDLGGRNIRVSYANERPPRNFGGGGYNNGGGGYGNNGGGGYGGGGRNDGF